MVLVKIHRGERLIDMGGLAGMYEEFREAILDKGGDDPALAWSPFSDSCNHSFSITNRKTSLNLSDRYIEYAAKDIEEEIATCRALIDLCDKQDIAIKSFYTLHTPRSRSFEFWFDIAINGISERRKAVNRYLSQIGANKSKQVIVPVLDIPVPSRLLEYTIGHIIDDELRFQTADKTELINIIEDATYYISNVENVPFVRDKSNSIWKNYIQERFSLQIRDDHCCKHCGSELFVGIPYCMNCNSLLCR